VDAVDGAGVDAGTVFGADTGFCDYIGHLENLLRECFEAILCRS
jgi:hypothetical protein